MIGDLHERRSLGAPQTFLVDHVFRFLGVNPFVIRIITPEG